MNPETGDYYESLQAAVDAGEKKEQLIEVSATQEQIEKLSADIKRLRRMDVPKTRKPRRT